MSMCSKNWLQMKRLPNILLSLFLTPERCILHTFGQRTFVICEVCSFIFVQTPATDTPADFKCQVQDTGSLQDAIKELLNHVTHSLLHRLSEVTPQFIARLGVQWQNAHNKTLHASVLQPHHFNGPGARPGQQQVGKRVGNGPAGQANPS